MGRDVGIFNPPAYIDHAIHFILVSQVKGDRAVDLLKAQSRIMRLDRFGVFAISIVPNDAVYRHTTPEDVETSFAPFNVFLSHDHARFQSTGSHGSRSYRQGWHIAAGFTALVLWRAGSSCLRTL